eukprot:TRINITY_DN832_c0_g1_i1.p1 TRINITY_DN832_c0_g1~~TRINITY_DN832_c0_g1_i1.p1  ORF type:complete len:466 (+),score=78.69 TRINITY_DN832_c0_g1_i1:126-1400(+)
MASQTHSESHDRAPSTEGWEPVHAAKAALRISNPIRDIVDSLKVPKNATKDLISLSIGDPTIFGNLSNPTNVNETLINNVRSGKFNGYAHSCGYPESRAAVAKKYSYPDCQLSADDVVISNGCSGAIEMAISVLASEGHNILLPAPGFSIYQTICEYKNIVPRYYRLLPEHDWEVDLKHLESQIDNNTVAILVNNPSNPCGSNYSREHLKEILEIAERHRKPVIADEIYGGMVFGGQPFYPLAELTKTVPIIAVGGISKLYLSPGWRVGWVIVYDRLGVCKEVKTGLVKLSQLILGANTVAQSIIPEALNNTPQLYYDELCKKLEANAKCLVQSFSNVRGLKVVSPKGAMYMMLGIDISEFSDIKDDVEFSRLLLEEEVVLVLPGKIFRCDNFVRIVICPPVEKLEEAAKRIVSFVERHRKKIM